MNSLQNKKKKVNAYKVSYKHSRTHTSKTRCLYGKNEQFLIEDIKSQPVT